MITYPVWMKAIIYIEESKNAQQLSQKIYMTYTALIKIVLDFEKKGWITRELKGREKINKLTPKGKEIQKSCQTILQELNGLKVNK
ncbi:MAG: hypothetical protein ACOCP8_05040 [archaeon]